MSDESSKTDGDTLQQSAASCRYCRELISHEPRPVFLLHPQAKIAIISQAPGRLAHESGVAWNDPSGDRLRHWLGLSRSQFYSERGVSVIPMSFCFPGYKNGADAPPLKPCAPRWHAAFLDVIKPVMTVYIGRYAQSHYLPQYATLTDAVADWRNLGPDTIALPHPSGRNNRWFRQHDWFERDLVPQLRTSVSRLQIT